MSNVIPFRPANEIDVRVNLDSCTLQDVIEAMYGRYDVDSLIVVYVDGAGDINYTSDMSEAETLDVIADILDSF